MRTLLAITGLALLLSSAQAQSQDPPRDFCADRPGKGSPPCVLDAVRFQAELGIADGAWSRGGGTATSPRPAST